MVDVLVILDGASEPLGDTPTSLERASTPVLDRLAREGALSRVRTVADGLPAGSECAIPALLGWTPTAPVDRAALEVAARELVLEPGELAWRIDVLQNSIRADDAVTARAAALLAAAAEHDKVRLLGGHRLLLTGPPPLPVAARRPGLQVWPHGITPPQVLDEGVAMIAARGAAAGAARLMGASVVVPGGATGHVDTDLLAKAAAVVGAIESGARRVVVHVGAPDEAAHELDAKLKVAAIERIDAELLSKLVAVVESAGGTLTVCPDHGCDPATGQHDSHPVPCVTWPAADSPPGRACRFTERDVAAIEVSEPKLPVAA